MRRLVTLSLRTALLLTAVVHPTLAQSDAPAEHLLDNGLRIRLMPNPGSGLVASNVFVGAGSTREEDRFAGSSHFLEHLLFNGTERRTQEELYAEVDRIGAYNNATTRQEFTHFMMVAPREMLNAALDIQADMLLHSILPEDKFEKERGIVIEEISKDRDDPEYLARRALDTLLFGGANPDFARPVLGTPETIAALPREAVLEYYHRQYVPSNMLVLLMGDFDPRAALEEIERLFDAAAGHAAPAPDLAWPAGPGLRTQPLAGDRTHLQICLPVPLPGQPGYSEVTLLASILGEDDASRIQRALAEEPPLPTASLSVGINHREGQAYLGVDVSVESGVSHEEVIRRICGAMAQLAQWGVTETEWRVARTRALGAAISQVEQLHYYALLQSDRIWHSPAGFEVEHPRALAAAWPRLQEVARATFGQPALQICAAGPELTPTEETVDLAAWGYRAGAAPTRGDEGAQVPEVAPEEAPVVTEIQDPTVQVLPSGMTLIHAAAPTTRMFGVHLMVRDRGAREPEGMAGIADLLHRLLPNGAGPYDREQLALRLASMGAELKVTDNPWIPYDDYYTTPRFSFVRLECVDEYYAEALRLLALMITEPHVDAAALENARNEMLGILGRNAKRPRAVASQTLDGMLYAGHPLAVPVFGTAASLARITEDDLRAFAQSYFDPVHLVLAVVGNVPREVILDRVQALFPAEGPGVTVPPHATPPALTKGERREEIEVGGEQSALEIGRVVQVRAEDRWALPVVVRLASDQMQQDLRETRGLAYSLGIGATFFGDRAALVGSMGTRPENLEEAESGMLRYLTGGSVAASPAEIEAAVNGHLGRMRMRRVTRLGQAYNLCHDYVFGEGLDHARQEAQGMQAVTAADVQRAAKRYLGPGPRVTVLAR